MDDPFIDEVERLANNANASITQSTGFGPKPTDIKRWMKLFHYDELEARHLIQRHRDDVIRNRVPDAHWDLVREEREARGYDREAYEHVLQLSDLFLEQAVTVPTRHLGGFGQHAAGEAVQIIRIGGILRDAKKVKEIGGLDEVPQVVEVVSEEGIPARLCRVSIQGKKRIKEWLDGQRVLKQPMVKKALVAPVVSEYEFREEEMREVDEMLPQRRSVIEQ